MDLKKCFDMRRLCARWERGTYEFSFRGEWGVVLDELENLLPDGARKKRMSENALVVKWQDSFITFTDETVLLEGVVPNNEDTAWRLLDEVLERYISRFGLC